MLRPATTATVIAAAMLVFGASTAFAANPAPNPPPGGVAVQPVAVTAGSSSQPSGNANASTGQANAGSNGQDSAVSHCGVQGSASGQGTSAQPASIGTAGSGTPTCSTASNETTSATSTGQSTYAARSGSVGTSDTSSSGTGSGQTVTTTGGLAGAKLVGSASSSSGWINLLGWLFLALLLAVLFLLIGIAVGRRRTARSAA